MGGIFVSTLLEILDALGKTPFEDFFDKVSTLLEILAKRIDEQPYSALRSAVFQPFLRF